MSRLKLPELTKEEQAHLISYTRMQKGERRLALRSQIILDWIKGLTYKQSAEKTRLQKPLLPSGANGSVRIN